MRHERSRAPVKGSPSDEELPSNAQRKAPGPGQAPFHEKVRAEISQPADQPDKHCQVKQGPPGSARRNIAACEGLPLLGKRHLMLLLGKRYFPCGAKFVETLVVR